MKLQVEIGVLQITAMFGGSQLQFSQENAVAVLMVTCQGLEYALAR